MIWVKKTSVNTGNEVEGLCTKEIISDSSTEPLNADGDQLATSGKNKSTSVEEASSDVVVLPVSEFSDR